MRTLLDQRTARVERAERLLVAFSYREVLKRGFALVRDGDGRPLHAAADVSTGLRLDIEFADGRVGAIADGEARPGPVPKPKPRGRGGEGGQAAVKAACSARVSRRRANDYVRLSRPIGRPPCSLAMTARR